MNNLQSTISCAQLAWDTLDQIQIRKELGLPMSAPHRDVVGAIRAQREALSAMVNASMRKPRTVKQCLEMAIRMRHE